MKAKLIKILSLITSIALVFSVAAACPVSAVSRSRKSAMKLINCSSSKRTTAKD